MKATLTYHSIDASGSPISLTPDTFQSHLRWLTSGRVRVLSLDALAAHTDESVDAVAVTFDDGFVDVREAVGQLLDHGIAPTIFVVTGHVGLTNAWGGREQSGIPTLPLMGWDDLERLASRGAHVEAHSRTHPALTHESVERMEEELGGSQADLRARLGVSSGHFAYPYGDLDDRVIAQARRFYAFGHTTELDLMRTTVDPIRLCRLDMYYFRESGAIEAWGTPRFRRRLAWCRARRAIRTLISR